MLVVVLSRYVLTRVLGIGTQALIEVNVLQLAVFLCAQGSGTAFFLVLAVLLAAV
jgi:hypothetical protein